MAGQRQLRPRARPAPLQPCRHFGSFPLSKEAGLDRDVQSPRRREASLDSQSPFVAWRRLPFVVLVTDWLQQGDRAMWVRWEQTRQNADLLPGDRLGIVESIRNVDDRGTRGYITWFETGVTELFWSSLYGFELDHGLHVNGNYSDRDDGGPPLYFINAVKADMEPEVRAAWRRHELRRRTRQAG